jgi:LAGLIDADG-like domain
MEREHLLGGDIWEELVASTDGEIRSYLAGASRDGYFNKTHETFRFTQKSHTYIFLIDCMLRGLGYSRCGWKEGDREMHVLEAYSFDPRGYVPATPKESAAFVRGYFDAEGGVPHKLEDRMYIQLCQKDWSDLSAVRERVVQAGITCGRLHNPSSGVDPNYWRFYVSCASHEEFWRRIRCCHPVKRGIFIDRFGELPPLGPRIQF